MISVSSGANIAVNTMLLIWISTWAPHAPSSANGAMNRPVARAPQAPPIPWTPKTSSESSYPRRGFSTATAR